jgi:hypothetical protein
MLEGRTGITARAKDGSSKWDMKQVSIEKFNPNKWIWIDDPWRFLQA